jgi:3-hydroxybutyryl-CoA dehydrogenase
MKKLVGQGRATKEEAEGVLARITATPDYAALRDADLVVEAVFEDRAVKADVTQKVAAVMKPGAIFASNTSSLSITEMSNFCKRPERFLGLHFFNPVPLMKLVEVIRALPTTDAAFELAKGFVEKLGKTAVVAKDTPGFVVNRLLVPYLLDAARIYESGVASKEDIDNGMKLGCGYPMGPLTLLDFVGLDTTLSIADIMFEEFKLPQYAAPPLLKRMVLAGYLGRKSGRGFYDYSKS